MTIARVAFVNVSNGGVPKRSVASARIHALGLEGDAVRHPEFHGGPERAVCLYALERIRALQEEGHPIAPGTTGENLTLEGVDFARLGPGARVHVGPDVVLQVTSYTTPCRTIAGSFADGDSTRILQRTHPGWSRLYARVLAEGLVAPGMPVRTE